jgi:hypothetical protein
MENWREFQKRRLRERLEQQSVEATAAIKTALAELGYLESVLLDSGSQAQFLNAQRTFMNVQAKVMRLQLEAMLKE